MARRKLKIAPDFNFLLIDLATPLQDYRLAWWVNRTLHKDLARVDDLIITDPDSRKQTSFSRFDYREDLTRTVFHLLQNRQGSVCVLPEVREVDFLLLIKGDYYRSRLNAMARKLRSIEQMQAVAIIDPEQLRNRNNLIIDTPATDI